MQSEVRKVLEKMREQWEGYSFYDAIRDAERADAAWREEPVRVLRHAVKQLIVKWIMDAVKGSVYAEKVILQLVAELDAIIATTKPDTVEVQPATASVPVTVQQVREIAAQAVRDAMPDVLDMIADSYGEYNQAVFGGGYLRHHAAKLRKERGA